MKIEYPIYNMSITFEFAIYHSIYIIQRDI